MVTLEPRIYRNTDDEFIQDQYEEIFEVVFIYKGLVAMGYRLFNELLFGLSIGSNKRSKNMAVINDFSCLHNKSSEFLCKPINVVDAFAIRRERFAKIMAHPLSRKIKTFITKNYKYQI